MAAIAQSKNRHVADPDLSGLSTAELVALLRNDVRELDARLVEQRDRYGGLIAVYCCNRFLGRFMPVALVRCPRCKAWHAPRV